MKKGFLLGLSVVFFAQNFSYAMNLQEYLQAVEKNHKSVEALRTARDAAEIGKEASDLELAPVFSAETGYINDKSPLSQFAMFGSPGSKSNSYSLGLGKKFATGTAVSLTAVAYQTDNGNLPSNMSKFSDMGVGMLGVGFSQSLLRDGFGNATHLRWQRQDAATAATVGTFDLQRRQLLVGAEAAFWSYQYAQENVKIGKESLDRAKRILNWTQRRVNDGISDRADLYQTQALVVARQLQLVSAEDELAAAQRSLRDFLELSDDQPLPAMTGDISVARSLASQVEGFETSKNKKAVSLDSYLASLEAKAKIIEAKESDEKLKPDLVLSGSYNTNSFDTNLSDALQDWTRTDRPTTKVGLKFTYPIDLGPKSAAHTASRKSALVAQLQSERKMLESASAWSELNRRYLEMSKRIEAAAEIARLQLAAAKAQAELFNKGRAVTANVITAEEDAGNAALNLAKLKSEQRKMEAQGRLFVVIEE